MSILLRLGLRQFSQTIFLGTGFCCLAVASAYAQQAPVPPTQQPSTTYVAMQGSEQWMYDSNPLKLLQNYKSLNGYNTSGVLILNSDSQAWNLDTNSEVDNGSFQNPKFDSTDFHEKTNASIKNDVWKAGLGGQFDYDTTRTSEITTYGITFPSVRHTGESLSPEIDFNPDTVEKLAVKGTLSRSTYDNTAFTNYNFDTINPTYSYIFDPLNTGLFTMNYQRYSTINGIPTTVNTYGPSLGWIRVVNPNMTFKVTAGAEDSEQNATAGAPASSSLNYVFSGDMSIKALNDTFTFDATRSQQPFGNGSSALFTSFKAADTHAINERLSLNASGTYRFAQYLENSTTSINLNREYDGTAGVTYRIYTNLDFIANYQYTNQTLTNINGAVKEQTVMVGLSFHPIAGAL